MVNRRLRAGIEATLATVSAVLVVVSLVWPTWFESLLGESPDGGDGSAERLLALGWVGATVLFSALARRDWRIARAASA